MRVYEQFFGSNTKSVDGTVHFICEAAIQNWSFSFFADGRLVAKVARGASSNELILKGGLTALQNTGAKMAEYAAIDNDEDEEAEEVAEEILSASDIKQYLEILAEDPADHDEMMAEADLQAHDDELAEYLAERCRVEDDEEDPAYMAWE